MAKRVQKVYIEKPYRGVTGSYILVVGDERKFVAMKSTKGPTRYLPPTDQNCKQLYRGEPLIEELSMQEYASIITAKAKAEAEERALPQA